MLGRLRKLLFADPIGGNRQTHRREGRTGAWLENHPLALVLPEMRGGGRVVEAAVMLRHSLNQSMWAGSTLFCQSSVYAVPIERRW